jgi:diguanylate cyclase (GGDEF)-like protein
VPSLQLALNVSARQVIDPHLPALLGRALTDVGLPGEAVTLEITESVLMSDPAQACVGLSALKDLGVRLAIDDFGTGYSSLSYLRRFPVDQVKIDRTFVCGLHPGAANEIALLGSILELSRTLGLQTVAEGIEDIDQFQRKLLEAELRHQATHDALTGLANRTLASERLAEALEPRASGQVGLLFCDLDGFKAVNDRLGHDAGDELLQQTAERMRRCIRPGDLLARFDGDEFVVVLGAVQTAADVERVGRRIVESLAQSYPLSAGRVTISASVGGAIGTPDIDTTPLTLMRAADAAMYAAKAGGKNRVELFDGPPTLADAGAAHP